MTSHRLYYRGRRVLHVVYYFHRPIGVWAEIVHLTPSDARGKTQVSVPVDELEARLEAVSPL